MPVDVADWILAVLESTHPIIFCCWPAEIPGFVFYRAQQTLAPLGKRLKGRHQPSASRQALGGSRRLEALGTAPAPLGKRLESLGTAPAPLGKRFEGLGTVPAPLGKRLETLTGPSAKLGNNCSVLLM